MVSLGLRLIFLALALATLMEQLPVLPDFRALATGIFIFTPGTLLPSLAEDLLTRGYLYHFWQGRYLKVSFVLVSALLFLLNHISALSEGPLKCGFLILTGIALALPLVITGRLWWTFGAHWAINIGYRLENDVLAADAGPNNAFIWQTLLVFTACTAIIYFLVSRAMMRTKQTLISDQSPLQAQ